MTETYEKYEVGELVWVESLTSAEMWNLAMILSCDDDELRNSNGDRFWVLFAGESKERIFHCSWFKKMS
jgi:hypothetical protein